MRTCKEMGIKTVAIFSDADARAVSYNCVLMGIIYFYNYTVPIESYIC